MTDAAFTPGSLVRARSREWIVLSGSTPEVLRLRPVTGSEEDVTRIHLALERSPVRPARFPLPLACLEAVLRYQPENNELSCGVELALIAW